MGYTFRKLYVDVVAPDGTVAVLYLTWLRLWRRWYGRSAIELYRPSGRWERIDLPDAFAPMEATSPVAHEKLRFSLPGVAFDYAAVIDHGEWAPEGCPRPSLVWRVKAARARASLRSAGVELLGTGYADFVEMTATPRAVGLRTLWWGRAHLPERTVIFEDLEFTDGHRWQVGLDLVGAEPARTRSVRLALGVDGAGTAHVGASTFEVTPTRVLHQGDAFEARRVPSLIERAAANLASGPVRQTRWLGLMRADDGGEGPALYEHVTFGRGP